MAGHFDGPLGPSAQTLNLAKRANTASPTKHGSCFTLSQYQDELESGEESSLSLAFWRVAATTSFNRVSFCLRRSLPFRHEEFSQSWAHGARFEQSWHALVAATGAATRLHLEAPSLAPSFAKSFSNWDHRCPHPLAMPVPCHTYWQDCS